MIAKGEIFVNYAAFQSALKQYCRETNQEFVVAKSEVNNKNSDPSLPFKLKELKCAHHRRTKCRANLRLNLEKAGTHKNKYMIVTMNDEHTSECPFKNRHRTFTSSHSNESSTSDLLSMIKTDDCEPNIVIPCTKYQSLMSVSENMFNECCTKALTNQKYLGLRDLRLRDYLFFIFVISFSNMYYIKAAATRRVARSKL